MRTELEHRPALVLLLSLVLGIAIVAAPINALFVLLVLGLRLRRSYILTAAGLLLGIVIAPTTMSPVLRNTFIDADVNVVSVPEMFTDRYRCEVASGDTRFYLYTAASDLCLGERVHLTGVVQPLDEAAWKQRDKGIVGRISAEPAQIRRVEDGATLSRMSADWRRSFAALIDSKLSPRAAEIVGALCFNLSGRLPSSFRQGLQETGTAHIVSASGLHVMIVALGVSGLLTFLPIDRRWQVLLLGLLLGFYALAAGLNPPVVRASVMCVLLAAAYAVQREPDVLNILGVAAFGYVLFDPRSVRDAGFQLSFITVAALALALRVSESSPRDAVSLLKLRMKQVMLTTLFATLGSLPLVAHHFGVVSLSSVPANLLIVPVLMPVVLCALLGHVLWFIVPGLALVVLHVVVEPLAGWLAWVVESLSSFPGASVNVPPFSGYVVVLAYALMLALWRWKSRPA